MFDDEMISKEFPQVHEKIYFDHAAAPIPPKSLLECFTLDISTNLYSNPHSRFSPSAELTLHRITQIRHRILENFYVDSSKYSVIFTLNATGAFKTLADCLPRNIGEGSFLYLRESHTSVLGMRNLFPTFKALESADVERALESHDEPPASHTKDANIFVYPAQCNFSGTRYPLEWIKRIKRQKSLDALAGNSFPWKIILDASSFLLSSPLDLSMYPADFVVFSFYKIFGFPTSIGAILVKNDCIPLMNKSYFGGGTIDAACWNSNWRALKHSFPENFEDGTLPFLEILAIDHGYDMIERFGGYQVIHEHIFNLMKYAKQKMAEMIHRTNSKTSPLCVFYPSQHVYSQGPIITFNLLDQSGQFIGCHQVAKLAAMHQIHIRSGCFCNPGACSSALELLDTQVQENFEIHQIRCGDERDILNGRPLGAIRLSFGLLNTKEQINAWIAFLYEYFIHPTSIPKQVLVSEEATVVDMFVYPMKSCGGYRVDSWPISKIGFLMDRFWKLVDSNGRNLTLKRCPLMTHIRPIRIDLEALEVEFEFKQQSKLILRVDCKENALEKANEWFSSALKMPCYINSCDGDSASFSNQSHYLLVSNSTFLHCISSMDLHDFEIQRFRPNIIIASDSFIPFSEEKWVGQTIQIGSNAFHVSERCQRCTMVSVDQKSGICSHDPYKKFVKFFGESGRFFFGIHLFLKESMDHVHNMMHVGDNVRIQCKY